MKPNKLILLAVAAGCGLVAMLGVQQMMSGGTAATSKTKILVAKAEIGPGVPLDKAIVGFKEWPNDALPEGAITNEDDITDRSLKHHVGTGQPILATELGKKGEYGLEVQIPEGMTVQTIPVNGTQTHSGLLKPGAYVDVSATIEYALKEGKKEVRSQPVLSCLKVIAVDDQVAGTEAAPAGGTAKEAKNVSFLVFPRQGQLLMLAVKRSGGSIQLALRGKTDKSLANVGDLSDEAMSQMSNQLFGEADENNNNSSKLASTAVTPTASTEPVAKPKSSIRKMVKTQTSPAVTEVGDQTMKRTWKIEIFQGDKREVQEIDYPEEPVVNVQPAATKTGNSWSNPLMKFFTSSSKSEAAPPKREPATAVPASNQP